MKSLSIEEVLQRTSEVINGVITPQAEAIDTEAAWPESGIHALQDAGLGGLVVSKKHGGNGHGLYALAQICEVIGSSCASTAMCFGMHCVGSAVMSAKATSYHREHYLDAINRGEHITSLALSESGSGAHFYYPQTQLGEKSKTQFLVNGEKTFVTNGSHADSYVISTAEQDGEGMPGQFSCLVIDKQNPGLHWGPDWHGFGMRGNSSRQVDIKNAIVPRKCLLGKEGDQMWYIFSVVAPYFLTAMAGTYLGIAASALSAAQEHLTRRRYATSGNTLAQQQVLQHRLGQLWAQVERSRRFLYHTTKEYDDSKSEVALMPAILSAKAEIADAAVHVVNEAMTLMGGMAYREGATLQRNLRDVRAAHVMAPTTDILRIWTGRALLGLPLLSE